MPTAELENSSNSGTQNRNQPSVLLKHKNTQTPPTLTRAPLTLTLTPLTLTQTPFTREAPGWGGRCQAEFTQVQ